MKTPTKSTEARRDRLASAGRRSVHDSQARLGLEHIPLIQVHELRTETWEAVMRPGGSGGTF